MLIQGAILAFNVHLGVITQIQAARVPLLALHVQLEAIARVLVAQLAYSVQLEAIMQIREVRVLHLV